MKNYLDKLGKAYNDASAAISLKAKSMDSTPQSKSAFQHFMQIAVSEEYPEVVGAVKTLSHLDYNDVSHLPDQLKAMLAAGQKEIKAFQPIKQGYLAALDRALTQPITLAEELQPTSLKDLAPDAFRATKVLKTEVEAIYARAVQDWEAFDKQKEASKIQAEGEKKAAKVEDEAEKKQHKDMANAKMALLTFGPKLKSAVAKGTAAVQKIKADPSPANYNHEMSLAGRDLSQCIVNIEKWRNNEDIRKIKAVRDMPDPGSLAARIAAFGDGTRKTVQASASPQHVLAELKDYTTVLKEIATVYDGVINGKMASKFDR